MLLYLYRPFYIFNSKNNIDKIKLLRCVFVVGGCESNIIALNAVSLEFSSNLPLIVCVCTITRVYFGENFTW